MPRTSFSRHAELLQVTDAQAGLITAAQLASLGVHRSTVGRRTRPGGMWTRILPSVHMTSGGNPTVFQREVAALLYSRHASVITGLAALSHHGLDLRGDEPSDGLIHILVPHEYRLASRGFVRVERTRSLPPPVWSPTHPPLPLAPPARAVADAARHFRAFAPVHTLVTESLRRGLTTVEDLRAELATAPRQGSGHLRETLEHADSGALSVPEADLLALVASAGLPTPLLNRRLYTRGGRFIAIPDAWFDDVGLALEVDSDRHHAFGLDLERTISRNSKYVTAGVPCLQVAPRDIRDRPAQVVQTLRDAYASAARLPRPSVVVGTVTLRDAPPRTPPRWGG